MTETYLNLGCGKAPIQDFVNIDIEEGADLKHDVTEGLPFDDDSVDGIYSEHFIEHITQAQGAALLRECRRVLKPGAVVRIATPDLDVVVGRYGTEDWLGSGMKRHGFDWVANRAEMLNIAMREWGHQWVYNEEELVRLGRIAGLELVGRFALNESADPKLANLETRPESYLIVEFRKPVRRVETDALVSILIPAYNPRYLGEALDSALGQTYPHIEVVICDDDRSGAVRQVVEAKAGGDPRVRYLPNPKNLGGKANYGRCFAEARGAFIKFLNDDDTLAPTCVERMLESFVRCPSATLVTSHRQLIDPDGNPLPDIPATLRPVAQDSLIDGRSLVQWACSIGQNIIGEPTTVMFRKADALDGRPHLFSFAGVEAFGLGDLTLWTSLLSKGNAVYLYESLSCFRRHPEQRQALAEVRERALRAWEVLRFHAKRMGLFEEVREFKARYMDLDTGRWEQGTVRMDAPGEESGGEELASGREAYQAWIDEHALRESDGEVMAQRMVKGWMQRPAIHLIIPVEQGQETALIATLDSLGGQLYRGWGVTVVANTDAPAGLLEGRSAIQWHRVDGTPGPVAASVLKRSQADWIALVEPGLCFPEHALFSLADYINIRPRWGFIYVDEDRIDAAGNRHSPRFKPDFNPDLLRSMPYLGALCLVRRDVLLTLEPAALAVKGCNYDLALKTLETYGESLFGHIADVLVHVPVETGETSDPAVDGSNAREIVAGHLARSGIRASVEDGYIPGSNRVVYRHDEKPLVTVVIPTKDNLDLFGPCLETLFERTAYPSFEVLVVDNDSVEEGTREYYDKIQTGYGGRLRIVPYAGPYNVAAMTNSAVSEARGDYVVLLSNDTLIVQAEWLERMLEHGQRPDVGVVGARLIQKDGKHVQHAGIVLGMDGLAQHIFRGSGIKAPGYMGRAQLVQDYSAVAGYCLLVRKSLYEQVAGMDGQAFSLLGGDLDLCLKIGQAGYKVLWTPYAMVVHSAVATERLFLSASKETKALLATERMNFLERWLPMAAADPAYNRHLSLAATSPRLETEYGARWDTNFHDRPRLLGFPLTRGAAGELRIAGPLTALDDAAAIQAMVTRPLEGQARLSRPASVVEIARLSPDVLVIQSAVGDGFLDAMDEYQRLLKGVFRIYDLEDWKMDLPEKNSRRRYIPRDMKTRIKRALASCDRLLVCSEHLAELHQGDIDDIRVVPNYLPASIWGQLTSQRRVGAKPRVGWAGAQQHQGDLEILIPVVKETAAEVDWVFFGMCLDELKPYAAEVHDYVLLNEYPAKLASLNLDLAVAPLEYHPFNQAKSHLRLLEYGILGWPVVCTDIEPYRGAPVCRVAANEPDTWLAAIRERIYDLDAAAKEGDALRQWVLTHWMLEDHLDVFVDAFLPNGGGSRLQR